MDMKILRKSVVYDEAYMDIDGLKFLRTLAKIS